MSLLGLLIVLLVVFVLFGGYGHSRSWGYMGWSPLALLLVVLLILWLAGVVHLGVSGLGVGGLALATLGGDPRYLLTRKRGRSGPPGLPFQVSYWLGVAITVALAIIGYYQGQWIEGHGADTGLSQAQFSLMCAIGTGLGILGRLLPNVQHTPAFRQRELLHAHRGSLPADLKHLAPGGEPPPVIE